MTKPHKIPGPDHPITVEPTAGQVIARVGDRTIAQTTSALTLREADYPPVQYVPLADVDPAVLRRSDTTTYCPYKGDASYYSLALDGSELTDAVWTYETPYPEVGEIAGHVRALLQRGVITSTVGIGDGYDEELLGAIAGAGGGNLHDAGTAQEIAEIVLGELRQGRAALAERVTLRVSIPANLRAEIVGGRQAGVGDHALAPPGLDGLLDAALAAFLAASRAASIRAS